MHTPTVLVCDDEPFIISAIRRLARNQGLEVVGATDGAKVQEMASALQPDLIVMDVNQPHDGRDLLARLKSDPRTRAIKVLMFSAVEDQFTRLTCLELGAIDYAVKPLDVTLVAKLARLARSSGSGLTQDPRWGVA